MIIERLPNSLKNFLSEVESLGFSLTLVGGFSRDFLFSNVIGHDLDFEIRADKKIDSAEWATYYQKFIDYLNTKKLSYKVLPYLITRVDFDEFKLEFSSPRVEVNKKDNFSHHHFDAVLDSNLTCDVSFLRRDFTINAIGIKLDLHKNTEVIIDPFNGVEDLKNGVLKNITDEFFSDSVRFLRLIRFQIKFSKFSIDANLLKQLSRFNLTQLSVHHFKEELFKSRPGLFLNLFRELVQTHSLKVPEKFSLWLKYTFPGDLKSREELLGFVFMQNETDAENVAHFFSLPSKVMKDLRSFYRSYEYVSKVKEEHLRMLGSKNVHEALHDPLFKELKNLEEKKIWRDHLHLSDNLPIGWKDWSHLSIDKNEQELVAVPMRSYLIFYKALNKKYSHD